MNKFHFECQDCKTVFNIDKSKFSTDCPTCNGHHINAIYPKLNSEVIKKCLSSNSMGMKKYVDLLPINDIENIVSFGEGDVPVEKWSFLEEFAKKEKNIDCKVYAHRQDMNPKTGSFKDLAGALVATALKEANIKDYVVASTGNIGAAFSCYLNKAGINLHVFIPQNSSRYKEVEIASVGQTVYRVKGDYSLAKKLAMEFAQSRGHQLAASGLDPFRVEAKKTMSYDWLRCGITPSVYIQALSGGTGPFGIYKGISELKEHNLIKTIPRLILCQSDKCAPMATSWQRAKANDFPKDWNLDFDTLSDPETNVATLATGNPKAYPKLAPLVKESQGEILEFPEELAGNVALFVASNESVRIGPAAAIGIGGFFSALKSNSIKNGDTIMINIGEGIRRDPMFLTKIITDSNEIHSISCIDDIENFTKKSLSEELRNYVK